MMIFKKQTQQEDSDEFLWNKLRQGDSDALELIYCRYFATLYNYGLRLCGDEEIVKDCIQDLFVRLLSSKKTNTITNIRAYLMISLRNAIMISNEYMKNQLNLEESMFDFSVSEDELLDLFPHDDDSMQIGLQLRKAYEKLNFNQKQAIYLYYIKNFSWKEIGTILNITPHSCMNLVARAVSKLHLLMTGQEKIK